MLIYINFYINKMLIVIIILVFLNIMCLIRIILYKRIITDLKYKYQISYGKFKDTIIDAIMANLNKDGCIDSIDAISCVKDPYHMIKNYFKD